MGNQWDKELADWFFRCVEQDHPEELYKHYYGFNSVEEYEEYLHIVDKCNEDHPPSCENDVEPED